MYWYVQFAQKHKNDARWELFKNFSKNSTGSVFGINDAHEMFLRSDV